MYNNLHFTINIFFCSRDDFIGKNYFDCNFFFRLLAHILKVIFERILIFFIIKYLIFFTKKIFFLIL